MFIIEKNVAMKSAVFPNARGRPSIYPLAQLEVGDSFCVPIDALESIQNAAANYARKHGSRFSCRKIDGQIRVWRIS